MTLVARFDWLDLKTKVLVPDNEFVVKAESIEADKVDLAALKVR